MTAKDLFDDCAKRLDSYPFGMQPLPADYPIAGRGFFPVTSGSFHDGSLDVGIGERKILLIGQDWGSSAALRFLSDPNYDVKKGTGKILKELLEEVRIPLEDCFFSNALFGVREGKENVGRSPGWSFRKFVSQCVEALRVQLETLRPKAVICLGRDAPDLLVQIFERCGKWTSPFKAIDAGGHAVLSISDELIGAILLHPSFRKPNARRRSFKDQKGHAAEVAILQTVWHQVMGPAR